MNALIIAAGDIPSVELVKIRTMEPELLIAADNGITAYITAGIEPDVIIGDFDSADSSDIESYKKKRIEIIELEPVKNETDTEMAVRIAIERGATYITLLGATGARLDHTIANLMLLKYAYELSVRLVIEDDLQSIRLECGEFLIDGKPGDIISMFPVNECAIVSATDGLKYPLDRLTLCSSNTRGVSNALTENVVKVYSSDLLWVIKNKI